MSKQSVRFFRVSALPTSGYVTGGVYFVTTENKIYLRTSSGWEAYAGKVAEKAETAETAETAEVAERLAGVVESGGDDPVVIEDSAGRETLTVAYDSNASTYFGANVTLRKYGYNTQDTPTYDERRMELCGRGILIKTVNGGVATERVRIEDAGIYIGSQIVAIASDVEERINAAYLSVYSGSSTTAVNLVAQYGTHRQIVSLTSGDRPFNLPASPRDGETFVFMKIQTGGTVTINGNGKNIFLCNSGSTAESATISSSVRRRVTLVYSSSLSQWLLMADDFLSI